MSIHFAKELVLTYEIRSEFNKRYGTRNRRLSSWILGKPSIYRHHGACTGNVVYAADAVGNAVYAPDQYIRLDAPRCGKHVLGIPICRNRREVSSAKDLFSGSSVVIKPRSPDFVSGPARRPSG